MRAVAYKKTRLKSSVMDAKGNKQGILMSHHQSRTLVQLISIKTDCKAEFRDCSFRCVKVFTSKQSRNAVVGGPISNNNSRPARVKTDRSNSRCTNRKETNNNASSNRGESISVGPSENDPKDSVSQRKEAADTSGRILGRYFANEKEEE